MPESKPKKSKGLVIFIMILVVLVLFLLVRSLFSSEHSSSSSITISQASKITSVSTATTALTTGQIAFDKEYSYTESGVTISAGNLTYDGSYKFNLKIENSNSFDIYYEIDGIIINGYLDRLTPYGTVYAGMSDSTSFEITSDFLQLCGIEQITDIKFSVDVDNHTSKDEIAEFDFDIKTNNYGKYTQTYNFDGKELYNDNGIIISARPNQSGGVNHPLTLCIENTTDRKIMLFYADIAMNNEMICSYCSGPAVLSHSRLVCDMDLYITDDEPDIDEITNITLKFSVLPYRLDGSSSTADMFYTDLYSIDF